MTTSDTPVATRRQVLAFLALAGAPTPDLVEFHPGRLSIDVDSLAAGRAWTAAFGGTPWPDQAVLHVPAHGIHPERLVVTHEVPDWRGWLIWIHVTEPTGAGDVLDADTRGQLAAVAAGAGAQ